MMTKANLRDRTRASGFIDLVVVLATISLLVVIGLAFPRLPRGARGSRIACVNNLKQLGLAARIWSNDHGDVFPWNVPVSSNGMKELAFSGDLAGMFRAMSNEVFTP